MESYFQRFEAIYGALRFDSSNERVARGDFVDRLIRSVENPSGGLRLPQAQIFIGDIFHASLIIPIGLVTILTTLGWLLVLQPDFNMAEMEVADLTPKLTAVNFAFLGAYFFGIQMLFRRFVRRDLSPNAYFAFSNRVILAVIGVWLVAVVYPAFPEQSQSLATTSEIAERSAAPTDGVANSAAVEANAPISRAKSSPAPAADTGRVEARDTADQSQQAKTTEVANSADPLKAAAVRPSVPTKAEAAASSYQSVVTLLLAFTIGVFPRIVWQFLSAGATKLFRVKVVLPSVEAAQPLYDLDGLTVWHETRLEEEDVENVPNMASVDVVELMLHTQIPMERLVSWIDQAILLTVLGAAGVENRDKLRKLGLRTATQVVGVVYGPGAAPKILSDTLGADRLAALVVALQKEANFDSVRAWREI